MDKTEDKKPVSEEKPQKRPTNVKSGNLKVKTIETK